MSEKYWWMIIGIVVMFILARLEHNLRRRRQRSCSKCGHSTYRVHQMVEADVNAVLGQRRFGRYYQPYTFDVCPDRGCKRVKFVKSDDKWFSNIEIWWRKLKFISQRQFDIDPTLFERAGINGHSMPLQVRMLSLKRQRENKERQMRRRFFDHQA